LYRKKPVSDQRASIDGSWVFARIFVVVSAPDLRLSIDVCHSEGDHARERSLMGSVMDTLTHSQLLLQKLNYGHSKSTRVGQSNQYQKTMNKSLHYVYHTKIIVNKKI
jgi:hypothetical protein